MDEIRKLFFRWKKSLERYKYALAVLFIGVLLMCIPLEKKEEPQQMEMRNAIEEVDIEKRLEEMLSKLENAGEVQVLLTKHTDGVRSYQQDKQSKLTDDDTEVQLQTVIISCDGADQPIETIREYPAYRGAVVICQGADKASVRLAIIEAVSSATGLTSEHIAVIKMKHN